MTADRSGDIAATPATPATPAAPAAPARAGPYAWYVLLVLALVYVFNFVDRQILTILAEDIKRDLQLDDAQIGFLYGTAFAIFYALFGIPLGRLADTWRRTRLIGMGLGVWSGMTALSGFARTYAQLAVARIGVGVGEASASPAAYSLIADYFPKERRGLALSIYAAGLYIGGGIALPLGGAVSSGWNRALAAGTAPLHLAGWQAAFLVVGLPGLLLALWVVTLREPLRGASEGPGSAVVQPGALRAFGRELAAILPPLTLLNMARYPGGLRRNLLLLAVVGAAAAALAYAAHDPLQWLVYGLGVYAVGSWVQALKETDPATWRLTWGTPAFVMALVGFGSIAFVTYAAGFWGAPYLLRTFYAGPQAPSHFFAGLTAREEVAYFAVGPTIAAALGVILGGWLSDRWRRRDVRGRLGVAAVSVGLHMPLLAVLYTTKSLAVFFALQSAAAAASAMFAGAAVAVLQEMVLPRMRATAGAMSVLGATMVGLALGPYVTGKVAAVTGSLNAGIFSLYAVLPITGLLIWGVSRRLAVVEATREARAGEAA